MTAILQSDFVISARDFEPAYLHLYRTGELRTRIEQALADLESCRLCPRKCGDDRLSNKAGVCKTGRLACVSSYSPHHGEERCLSGWSGSGTILFSWCNLRCPFCQNYEVSHLGNGYEVSAETLAQMMLELQAAGCHNINLVSPSHVVPQILEALPLAVDRGFHLPLVYNTSSYDSIESIRLLDGIVDIYMPDFKIWNSHMAAKYLSAKDYPEAARRAIREMYKQVGDLKVDEDGLAKRGVLLRHLLIPGPIAGTREIVKFLSHEISPHLYINIMDQYYPAGKVSLDQFAEINRRITAQEFASAVSDARNAGLYRFNNS
jgi:putative pyruvate formate lyase activating enzyme